MTHDELTPDLLHYLLGHQAVQNLLHHYRKLETRDRLYAVDPMCAYCGRVFDRLRQSTIDHVHPLGQGGRNDETNMILACGACNAQKGGRTLAEWADRLRRQLGIVERMIDETA